MVDPVAGYRQERFKSPVQFMLALDARIHRSQPVFNAIFDGLVVAQFKMQVRQVPVATPVPAVQDGVAEHGECAGDMLVALFCQYQQGIVRHGGTQVVKEVQGQAGAAPAPVERAAIKPVEDVPVFLGDVGAAQAGNVYVLVPDRPAFPPYLLAPL